MKAIKKLLGGIGFLLITICLSEMFEEATGVWMYLSMIIILTFAIGIYLIIAGIFTKVE